MPRCRGFLFALIVFILWTLTSFLCHKLAKMAIHVFVRDRATSANVKLTSSDVFASSFDVIVFPLFVTLCQLVCCWGWVDVIWEPSLSPLLLLSHVLATLATNTSLAMTFASSTLAIKMLEPMTSAVLQRVTLKTSLNWQSVVSVVVVVVGAVLYVGSPSQNGGSLFLAILLAFLSNVALGVRNVAMKLSESRNPNLHNHGYHFRKPTSVISFTVILLLGLFLVYSLETSVLLLPAKSTQFLSLGLASGVFHVVYSFMSMKMVLRYMSVVSHSLANIFKRLLVVLLLYVTGRRVASSWNWLGLVLSLTGLCLYQRCKRQSTIPSADSSAETSSRDTVKPSAVRLPTKPVRTLLFLLTISYVLCVTSMWLSPGQSLHVPSACDRLHVEHLLHAHHAPNSEHDLHHHIKTFTKPPNVSVVDLLQYDSTGWSNLADTLPVLLDKTTNELFSPLQTMERLLSEKAKNTTDFARRLILGWVKWKDGQLLMNKDLGYQPTRKALHKVQEFLQKNPASIPFDTDGLSPYLATTRAVIAECDRVTLSLFHDLLAGKKYAILIGLADFENKGDPAITVGQVVLLEKLGIELIFYVNIRACSDKHMNHSLTIAQRYPLHEVVIVMNGGGNLIGYAGENNCRIKAFQVFGSYQQVIFSQSIYMRSSQSNMDKYINMYCCNPNLTILLRDRQSLHIARRIFNNGTRLLLAPDMAFQNGPVTRYISPFYDIMWLDRKDGERPQYQGMNNLTSTATMYKGDWFSMASLKGSRSFHTSINVMLHGFDILQRGRVVITERLHGHILSVLLDIPHVLLDNANLKLSSFYNTWTRGISNCRLTNTASHAVQLALDLLKEYNHTLPTILRAAHINDHPPVVKGGHK